MSTVRFLHGISARTARNSLKWLYLLVYSKVQITTHAGRPFYLATRSVLRETLVRGKKGRKRKKNEVSGRKKGWIFCMEIGADRENGPLILFVSGVVRPFLVRVYSYPIFFYHLIKQLVTRNMPSPTVQKAVFREITVSAALCALSLFYECTFVESTDYFHVDKMQQYSLKRNCNNAPFRNDHEI